MSILKNTYNRLKASNQQSFNNSSPDLQTHLNSTLRTRLNVRGGSNQWVRMRQDKLKSLKKALLYSYQSAIVQKYDVKKNSKANYIINLITKLQDKAELNESEMLFLQDIEKQYTITFQRDSQEYIDKLQQIIDELVNAAPLFRSLINHDKLKVDYEDKIISIPFEEIPLNSDKVEETGFHNGTIFKWVHGNKQEWTPDTYWIVYMQYSEETAYFRGQIRKADEQIEIVTIDDEGNEKTLVYRGWVTGPNETSILWNTKKNVTWNDMNYTKLLYITKDEDTQAFFKRFDRININGQPWQVVAYNENYSTSKSNGIDSGIIRVALKETYTNSNQFITETLKTIQENTDKQDDDSQSINSYIEGPEKVKPYSTVTFVAKNFNSVQNWQISDSKIAKIKKVSQDGLTATVDILIGVGYKKGFYINYGSLQQTKLHVIIDSM